jgi:hypothetical protein
LHYFRYKEIDGWEPTKMETDPLPDIVNVYSCKQRLPGDSFIADFEYAKLENGMGLFKKINV